jgi:hypothetical protein
MRAKDLSEKIKESLAYPETFGSGKSGTGYPLNFSNETEDGEGTRIENTEGPEDLIQQLSQGQQQGYGPGKGDGTGPRAQTGQCIKQGQQQGQ